MKFYKTILFTVLLFASLSKYSYSQDIPKPKKEILISVNSTYYKNAKEVVEGFFKQANIRNKSIDYACVTRPLIKRHIIAFRLPCCHLYSMGMF